MKGIICCACGSVPKYCQVSFKTQFPGEQVPPLYIKEKAKTLLEELPEGSEAYNSISTVLRKRGRYGFYYHCSENGEVLDCWNLLKHRRVA